jgi:hypothetical protein
LDFHKIRTDAKMKWEYLFVFVFCFIVALIFSGPLFQPTCGYIRYNPDNEGCCNGTWYIIQSSYCCDGVLYPHSASMSLCNGTCYNTSKQTCYKGNLYSGSNRACGDELCSPNEKCCTANSVENPKCYNPSYQKCIILPKLVSNEK